MIILVTDTQIVSELEDVLFTLIQQTPYAAQFFLTNSGVNTINYRFQQQLNDGTWQDLAALSPPNDLNSTLSAGQTKSVTVSGTYIQVRLIGNASGGAQLDFALTRQTIRQSRGALPILNI